MIAASATFPVIQPRKPRSQIDLAEATRRPNFSGSYRALWVFLLLGWLVSYADRTITGPVVAWMISNKAGFIGDATNPATLGGSMFFAGYMLTQYARSPRPLGRPATRRCAC
jgi:hypothetical protein